MAPSERALLLREGTQRGSAEDQFRLAFCYSNGTDGLTENKWMAAQLYGKAAGQGHAVAQVNLGVMYDKGEGVEQNLELAVSWYRQAAERGDSRAQFNLGNMIQHGNGVEQNLELAVSWYREAATQGHPGGQNNLGWMYRRGKGVEQNDKMAVGWWAKAVKGGNVIARYNLGVGYMYGMYGLPKDVVLAKAFMKSAAKKGHADAAKQLKLLGRCEMELEPGQCVSCGAPDITRTCLGCRRVRYCTLACQKQDWESHKPDCGGRVTCLCFSCAGDRPAESRTTTTPPMPPPPPQQMPPPPPPLPSSPPLPVPPLPLFPKQQPMQPPTEMMSGLSFNMARQPDSG